MASDPSITRSGQRNDSTQFASRRRFIAITLALVALGWGFSLLGVGRHVVMWLFLACALLGFMAIGLSAYYGFRLANQISAAVYYRVLLRATRRVVGKAK